MFLYGERMWFNYQIKAKLINNILFPGCVINYHIFLNNIIYWYFFPISILRLFLIFLRAFPINCYIACVVSYIEIDLSGCCLFNLIRERWTVVNSTEFISEIWFKEIGKTKETLDWSQDNPKPCQYRRQFCGAKYNV